MFQNIEKSKLVVTQANALALSAQTMTLQEKRLLLLLLSQIRRKDQSFKLYYIPVNTIGNYLEIKETAIYSRLRTITEKLLSRVVHIEEVTSTKEGNSYLKFQWLSHCKYLPKSKSPTDKACLEMRVHDHLHPLLLQLIGNFGSVPLLQMATMPSFTSIRMFELLYFASHKLGKKKLYFALEDLKLKLAIDGKYNNFYDLNHNILKRAQRDCAEKSPLIFTWEPEKQGRKVIGLHFFLEKNAKVELLPPPPEYLNEQKTPKQPDIQDQLKARELLEKHGINQEGPTGIAQLLASYDSERIIENCRIAQEKHAAGEVKTTLARLTISAIHHDYRKTNTSPQERELQAKEKADLQAKKDEEKARRELKAYNEEFNQFITDRVKAVFDTLSKDEQEAQIAGFKPTEPAHLRRAHKGKGLEHGGFSMTFFHWFKQQALSPMEQNFVNWMRREKGRNIEQDPDDKDEYRFKKDT